MKIYYTYRHATALDIRLARNRLIIYGSVLVILGYLGWMFAWATEEGTPTPKKSLFLGLICHAALHTIDALSVLVVQNVSALPPGLEFIYYVLAGQSPSTAGVFFFLHIVFSIMFLVGLLGLLFGF